MADDAPRGSLRTYLGTAPGVGKTYAMLADAHDRAATGAHVVVGYWERHGRARTAAQAQGLELVPPRHVTHRGHAFPELNVPGVVAAAPDLVLVDELAHTYPNGRRRRWEDVDDLLAAGLEVWTTTNVANLAGVRDYAARLTGAGAVEPVPDEFVRSGEVVLVDVPPDALRRRIAAGDVFSTWQVGGALATYFRAENLEALSELARAWVAGDVDRAAARILARHGVEPETRPLVVAGLVGLRGGERVIRRAAWRARQADGDLLVVTVDEPDATTSRSRSLHRLRTLTEEVGGRFSERQGRSPVRIVADAARETGAARLVVADRRGAFGPLARSSPAARLRRLLPGVPVEEVGPRDRVLEEEAAANAPAPEAMASTG